jgi:hypothetical protein
VFGASHWRRFCISLPTFLMREWNPKLNQWVAAAGATAHLYGGANVLPPPIGPATVRVFWGVQFCVAVLRDPEGNELYIECSEYQPDGTWRQVFYVDDYTFIAEMVDAIEHAGTFLASGND